MHCFAEGKQVAKQAIQLGFLLSFAGNITYPKARNLKETVSSVSLDKILLETDSPWLAPQEQRGKRNEPAFLRYTAEKMAQLKEVPLDEIAKTTTENALQAFALNQF